VVRNQESLAVTMGMDDLSRRAVENKTKNQTLKNGLDEKDDLGR
jgi:hypothetical protein